MQQQVFATPKFPSSTKSLHAELKRRVNEYLEQNQIKATGNFKLFSKAILLVSLLVVTYIHLVFYTPSTFFAILECVVFGGLIAAIGFNVMHDGSHGSFSKYAWLNNLASSSISVLGASRFMWGMKHVTIHHTYTNIDGVDDVFGPISIDNKGRINMIAKRINLAGQEVNENATGFIIEIYEDGTIKRVFKI